jgi:ribosome-interacting GTPase 1
MPANLTPDYLKAEQDYKNASTPRERIAALEQMLATVPKHKGTEKLQADIKRRLSHQPKQPQTKGAPPATPFYLVEREGAAQVAVVGPPNSGKSQLVASLSHARPEVADYPFTTRVPTPGMMQFEDVQIQLVDLPPVAPEFLEPWLAQAIRPANASILVVDLGDPALLDQVEFIEQWFDQRKLARPHLLAANKFDRANQGDLAALEDLLGERYRIVALSASEGINLDGFRRAVFDTLGLVRVYTKPPGKKAELTAPYVLRKGQTVLDAARLVHKDFAENLKFAWLYRRADASSGPVEHGSVPHRMVERTHVVEDGDILELHM